MTAVIQQAADRRQRSIAVMAALVTLLILFSEGFVQRLIAPEIEADGNIILRFMWLPVYGVVLALCLTRLKDIIHLALRTPALMGLVALASVSFLWSIDPSLSFRRGISIAVTTLFGLYLASRLDWRSLLMVLGGVWLFLAVISFLVGIIAPGFARMNEVHIGAWRGFWFEKNTLGGHMARAAALLAVLAALDNRRRWLWLGGVALAAALVLLSTSTTSLLGLLLGLAIVVAGLVSLRSPVASVATAWLAVTVSGAVAALFFLSPEAFFGLVGKDATLTGRTDIWGALGEAIAARPWLGYGYGAFWGLESEPAAWVRKAVEWDAPTAHNGWLDIALSVGLVGLALFTMSFAATLWRALWSFFHHRFGVFAVAMLGTLTLFSLSESILMEPNSLVWVTYVAVASKLARGCEPDPGAKPFGGRLRRPVQTSRATALEI